MPALGDDINAKHCLGYKAFYADARFYMALSKIGLLSLCVALASCLIVSETTLAGLIIIGFDSANPTMPFQTGGFTFTPLSGNATIDTSSSDRHLVINQPNPTAQVRITSSNKFDLLSFQVEGKALTWEFVSSSGAVYNLVPGLDQTLPSNGDWQNLSYVDIIHDDNGANAFILIDNMRFNSPTTSPEPSSLVLLGMAVASMAGVSRFRSRRKRRQDKSSCNP